MLTLKAVNELNKNQLTLGQMKTIYSKHGFSAEVFAGEIVAFVPKNFARRIVDFMQGIRSHVANA